MNGKKTFRNEDYDQTTKATLTYDEIDNILTRATADHWPRPRLLKELENRKVTRCQYIIVAFRESIKQNPEIGEIMQAMLHGSDDDAALARRTAQFPIATEFYAALEDGLVRSSHSTVVKSYIQQFDAEIDRLGSEPPTPSE